MEEELTYLGEPKIQPINWDKRPLWMPVDFEEYFGMACALTGKKERLTIDHALPREKGKRRNARGNLIPLNHNLNSSKGTDNLFVWFDRHRERLGLEQDRFDMLIYYLATVNGMTSKEYKDYYFKCYAEYWEVTPYARGKSKAR